MLKTISPQALHHLLESDEVYALIDVRERNEYEQGQIFGATLVPQRLLEQRVPVLVPVKDTKVVLYDEGGERAVLASRTLEKHGYTNIYYLAGGISAWQGAGFSLVKGVHVLSKSFGEIVGEIRRNAPQLSPQDLKQLIDANRQDYIVIEVRPAEEVEKTGSIPGAINIPGVELPLRIADYTKSGKKIITTCAGRTRGFIACATLKMMGIYNVYDLNNGTLGWQLAGFDLQQEIPAGPPPSTGSRIKADRFAAHLVEEQNIPVLSVEGLEALRQNAHRETLYLLDVRTPEEYEISGHIEGAISIPGGQAIQNTDDVVAVNKAQIVFICDNGTRSAITAYWYRQMGFSNVYILGGGMYAWSRAGLGIERGRPQLSPLGYEKAAGKTEKINAGILKGMMDKNQNIVIIDVGDSRAFAGGHIPGARWVSRGWLERRIGDVVTDKGTPVVVTGQDPFNPVYAALTLSEMGFSAVWALAGGHKSWLEAGYDLAVGLEGTEPDDWHVHLTEYGPEEAIQYFLWEESLAHLPEYMRYFRRKGIL